MTEPAPTKFVGDPLPKRRYVCGFLFDGGPTIDACSRVLLTRKRFPEWQSGLRNGIGGKIEGREKPAEAMQREGVEELRCEAAGRLRWRHFASEMAVEYIVAFFSAVCTEEVRLNIQTHNDVGEELSWMPVDRVVEPVVGNLNWLIPMARDWRPTMKTIVTTTDDISRLPTW